VWRDLAAKLATFAPWSGMERGCLLDKGIGSLVSGLVVMARKATRRRATNEAKKLCCLQSLNEPF